MICKVIQHERMVKTVNYLYDTVNSERKQMNYFKSDTSADSFVETVKTTMKIRNEKDPRKLSINNQIKHLVLSVHSVDNVKFEREQINILKDLFKELDVDPANNNANVFFHTDNAHNHIHVIFSKTGMNGKPMNDREIGKRVGEWSKKIDMEYNFFRESKPKTINISNQLYNPTNRGELVKTLKHCAMVVDSFENYKELLKYHGIFMKVSKNNDSLYYITKDKKVFMENNLPKPYKLNEIKQTLVDLNPSREFLNLSTIVNTQMENCKSLDDIKNLFPSAKIKYKIVDDLITDMTITTSTNTYHLSDFSLIKPKFDYIKKNDIQKKRVIFDNTYRKQGKANTYQEYLDWLNSRRLPLTIKVM